MMVAGAAGQSPLEQDCEDTDLEDTQLREGTRIVQKQHHGGEGQS